VDVEKINLGKLTEDGHMNLTYDGLPLAVKIKPAGTCARTNSACHRFIILYLEKLDAAKMSKMLHYSHHLVVKKTGNISKRISGKSTRLDISQNISCVLLSKSDSFTEVYIHINGISSKHSPLNLCVTVR